MCDNYEQPNAMDYQLIILVRRRKKGTFIGSGRKKIIIIMWFTTNIYIHRLYMLNSLGKVSHT